MMTKEELVEEYNNLVNHIANIEETRRYLRTKEKIIASKLQDIRLKANSDLQNVRSILPAIKTLFKVLTKFEYDEKLVCNHFGVDINAGIFNISIANREKNTFLIFKVKDAWVCHREIGCSKKTWQNIIKEIEKKYKIVESWNGGEGHNTMSVVIKKACPKSLAIALKNYNDECKYEDGFPEDTFDKVFQNNLRCLIDDK